MEQRSVLACMEAKSCIGCHARATGGGLGKGESWNGKVWHNKNVPNVAVVFLRPEAIVLGVTVRALCARGVSSAGAAGGYCGLPLVVVHDGSSIVPKSTTRCAVRC